MFPLHDQVALVTGGGRGIGAATAEALARKGAHAIVASRTESELAITVARLRSLGLSASTLVLDVADAIAVEMAFTRIGNEFGRLDILVNNAAILLSGPFADMAMSDWDRLMAINLRGAMLCAQQAFRLMREQGGSIVNVSSLGGVAGTEKFPGYAAYTVSKFALTGLTEALAAEGKSLKIRVNGVAPGAVDTTMLRQAAPHLRTQTTPADVAKVIAFLCDPSQSACMTGATLVIDSNL
ncbi:MAG TPA: SDR family NAD(P)-dependent oxidoreductase [Candidatus Competibacteraceae bacterium]|nr:MAG: SDR family oxidoreductase [Candidatus Competibacteraceae bacterium]HOB61612.1 SDR family NAD(P)-dependent oxidoreductase [Candidatus Competibacteraceae bacterium]HQA25213.1 SDR family NAD(P)-dependent oxidoreductase [Candidatus Competibacteraceae bacterium]HQD56169.1 SDR family NAD(P)-dependent oxidoreductase [Candidatus Competibacteraceae bacterium]